MVNLVDESNYVIQMPTIILPAYQSRTQNIPVRRLGVGHDSGETEYWISNFEYPVSCAHAHAQTATLNLRERH